MRWVGWVSGYAVKLKRMEGGDEGRGEKGERDGRGRIGGSEGVWERGEKGRGEKEEEIKEGERRREAEPEGMGG